MYSIHLITKVWEEVGYMSNILRRLSKKKNPINSINSNVLTKKKKETQYLPLDHKNMFFSS